MTGKLKTSEDKETHRDCYLLIAVSSLKATWAEEDRTEICGRIKTVIGPDSPDRWTDQIRHIDMYQTRQDNSDVRALSDPCGDVGG